MKTVYFAVNTADISLTARFRSPKDLASYLLGKRVDHYVIIIQNFENGQPKQAIAHQIQDCTYPAMADELARAAERLQAVDTNA